MLAFTFPGQGSQRPGMGRPWLDHESWDLVTEASDITGRDIAHLLIEADADELRDTRNAQLTMFVSSLVVLDAVGRLGIEANRLAGHSLGEYSALTAAGVFSYEEALMLVSERAAAMHDVAAAEAGVMAAVLGSDDEVVDVACRRADGDVWIANFNAPGQIVIAGRAPDLERAAELVRASGAKRVAPLRVAGAFHTPLMRPAQNRLRDALTSVSPHPPDVPVVANVDALPHADADDWPALCSAQLWNPVRWRHTIDHLALDGVRHIAELGPGGVLTGLTRRCNESIHALSVATPSDLDQLLRWLTPDEEIPLAGIEGEHLFAAERLIISPTAGIFTPAPLSDESKIEVGTVVGYVGDEEVRSPFAGVLQGFIALDTERVVRHQPIAWIRSI